MKIKNKNINLNNIIDVCVNVVKENLCFLFQGNRVLRVVPKRTNIIEKSCSFRLRFQNKQEKGLRIICEPTVQYQTIMTREFVTLVVENKNRERVEGRS